MIVFSFMCYYVNCTSFILMCIRSGVTVWCLIIIIIINICWVITTICLFLFLVTINFNKSYTFQYVSWLTHALFDFY